MKTRVGLLFIATVLIFRMGCCLGSKQDSTNERPTRAKRHVVFPVGGGTFKLVIGIGIPTKLGIKQSMAVGMNFQFQYRVPSSIRDIKKPYPPIIAKSSGSRRRRDAASNATSDRSLFYMGLEAAMNRNGLNGRACMLRAICDNGMHTLKHESNGLFGELMHIALTPSYHRSAPHQQRLDDAYLDAQRAGEFGVDCASLYPKCPAGANLLDTLSVLDN